MIRLITLLLLLGLTGLAEANTFKFNPKRTIQIQGPIDGSKLWTMNTIERLSRTKGDIDILINSGGGHIIIGNLMINAMRQARARGIKLRCVSTVIAASMAFQLLMECDERYAMRYTKLLFHPPRIFFQGTLLETQMRSWVVELDRIEAKLIPGIRRVVKLSSAQFYKHYTAETLWDAEDIIKATDSGWLHLVDDVQGVAGPHTMRSGGSSAKYMNGTLVYESEIATEYWMNHAK